MADHLVFHGVRRLKWKDILFLKGLEDKNG